MTFVTCRCCRCGLNWVVHCFNIAEIVSLTARQGRRQMWVLWSCGLWRSCWPLVHVGRYKYLDHPVGFSPIEFATINLQQLKTGGARHRVSVTFHRRWVLAASRDFHSMHIFRPVVMFTHSLSAFMCRRRRLSFSYVIRQASFLSVNKRRAFFRHRLT